MTDEQTSPDIATLAGELMHHEDPRVRRLAASALTQAPDRKPDDGETADPSHLTVAEGKYTLVMDPTNMRALRYGEPWRDLVGDGFVMALGHEIERLRKELAEAHAARMGD